ncbi:glycosyltransferase family 2 protein [Lysinibacter cavernae]
MKLVMTLMVRDEADIIEAMITHHQRQGVDLIVATDNGSVDGTREILEKYAALGFVDLRHDPLHRKQQSKVVTQMARDAATIHGATWVINADADEFWMPVDRKLTLKEAFEHIPTELKSFGVHVVDMTGLPASSGSGLHRLVYRDLRSNQELAKVGMLAHSSPNAVHIADPNVEVVQGNHMVSLESQGEPSAEFAVEVLHFPWRSWAQFEQKVRNAGKAYEENPDLMPSPNHHGMRDYRRLNEGTLPAHYLARSLTETSLQELVTSGHIIRDTVLADRLNDPIPDTDVEALAEILPAASTTLVFQLSVAEERINDYERRLHEANRRFQDQSKSLEATMRDNVALRNRRVVRLADKVRALFRR